jgi:hypothetical protein
MGPRSINFGGAKHASDKVVQHNGGGTVVINSFYVEDFGKLYRSCGNCKTQYKRAVQINDVVAKSGKLLAGINSCVPFCLFRDEAIPNYEITVTTATQLPSVPPRRRA